MYKGNPYCQCACPLAHPDTEHLCQLRQPVATVPPVANEFPVSRAVCRPCAEARGELLLPW